MLTDSENPDGADDDHTLMRKVAMGDTEAFRVLVVRHQDRIIGTISKMLGDSADSEDITQSVFLRVWKHAPDYQPTCQFTTYLFTIVRNLVFNEARRRARKPSFSHDQFENKDFLPPNYEQPDTLLINAELKIAIDHAIQTLPDHQRMAVILSKYEKLSYEEIATILHASVPSIKSLIFRARASLKESLINYLNK